ncbi:MAG: hypothetical protein OEL89_05055 [Candidatus Peregrinibacteria bacterium]|nr:hypothetical protein [Candidatus Peregrinibacteria bacterium]
MQETSKIHFTKKELTEFKEIWLRNFGEELSEAEVFELASDLVETLYALTKGEALKVRYNNTALVTTKNNPLNHG